MGKHPSFDYLHYSTFSVKNQVPDIARIIFLMQILLNIDIMKIISFKTRISIGLCRFPRHHIHGA